MLIDEGQFDMWRDQDFSIFLDEKIKYLAVDTRDFNSLVSLQSKHPQQSITKLKKYPERFFFTRQEVVDILNRIKRDRGDNRILLMGKNKEWIKYVYIWETPMGFTINTEERALTKEFLYSDIKGY